MQKESLFTNAYRYEPFQDIKYQIIPEKNKELFEDYSYFSVNSSTMGSISIPIQKNVSPSYPKTPEKISDYIVKNIWTYIQKPSDNNKNPSVVGSFNLTKTLRNYYNDEKDQHHPNAYKNSVYRLEEYLSKNYPNGNLYAQTRIVASYGMLQETFL